jgi:AcrR family transcriptional regulator
MPAPDGQPQRRRLPAAQRRAELVQTASEFFSRRSYGGTSIRDIAGAIGVNQALIYQHFSTKEELLSASMIVPSEAARQEAFLHLEQLCKAALLGDESRICLLNTAMMNSIKATLPFYGSVLYGDPLLGRQYFDRYWGRPLRDVTDHVLEFASQQKLDLQRDFTPYLLLALYGANLGAVIHSAFAGRGLRQSSYAASLSTMLARGLLAREHADIPEPSLLRPQSHRPVPAMKAGPVEEPAGARAGAEKRNAILAAARALFTERGKTGAPISVIARDAGVAEPTLYRLFASKDELFEAAMLEPLEAVVNDMVRLEGDFHDLTAEDRLPLGIKVNEEMSAAFREMATLLMVSLFSDRDDGEPFYQQKVVPLLAHVTDALKRSMTPTALSRMPAATLMHVMIGMHFCASTMLLGPVDAVDEPALAAVFSYIISFGAPSLLSHRTGRTRSRATSISR